jgi:hypothetical protein
LIIISQDILLLAEANLIEIKTNHGLQNNILILLCNPNHSLFNSHARFFLPLLYYFLLLSISSPLFFLPEHRPNERVRSRERESEIKSVTGALFYG